MPFYEGDLSQITPVLPGEQSCPDSDRECAVESAIWDQLQEEVTNGWRDAEEADVLFSEWRAKRVQTFGNSILRAS